MNSLQCTYLIDNETHKCFWHQVALCFMDNLQVRINQITDGFHLSFQLRIECNMIRTASLKKRKLIMMVINIYIQVSICNVAKILFN